jgi:hypothetical protein
MSTLRVPTAPVAAGSLIAGYVLARATKKRPLGGLPMLAGGGWCTYVWGRERGAATAAGLLGAYLAAFGGSHPLAKAIGSWPSVFTAAGVAGAAAWIFADRPA